MMPNRQCFGQSGRDGRRSPYKRRAAAAAVSIRSPDVLETVSWLSVDSVSGRPDGLNAYASGEVSSPRSAQAGATVSEQMASDGVRGDAFASHKKRPRTEPFFICTENSFSTVQVVDVHKILKPSSSTPRISGTD